MADTSYSFGLGNFERKIIGAEFESRLDAAAVLRVTIATESRQMESLTFGALPTEATFQWHGKTLFRGQLAETEVIGPARLGLVYRDGLQIAQKIFDNGYAKSEPLRDTLARIARALGLQARFYGDFSDRLPGINFGGQSQQEHLERLSNEYGFFFVARSASDTLAFIRVGLQVDSVSLNEGIASLHLRQSVGASFQKAHLRYFDAQAMSSQDKTLGTAELQRPVESFTRHSGFREKGALPQAKGSLETHVTDRHGFENGERLIAQRLGKRLMNQDQMAVTVFSPIAAAGDRLQLRQSAAARVADGDFLVKAVHCQISSARPNMKLIGMRP